MIMIEGRRLVEKWTAPGGGACCRAACLAGTASRRTASSSRWCMSSSSWWWTPRRAHRALSRCCPGCCPVCRARLCALWQPQRAVQRRRRHAAAVQSALHHRDAVCDSRESGGGRGVVRGHLRRTAPQCVWIARTQETVDDVPAVEGSRWMRGRGRGASVVQNRAGAAAAAAATPQGRRMFRNDGGVRCPR